MGQAACGVVRLKAPSCLVVFLMTFSCERVRKEVLKKPHPARIQMGLAEFFIQYLTDRDDWVLDPFAGSNTPGYAAARLARRWIAIDTREEYVEQSKIRFEDPVLKESTEQFYEHQ
jgi:DNA modification methylase